MKNKKLLAVAVVILILLTSYFFFRSFTKNKLPQIAVSETKINELASDFPNLPVYKDAKVVNSYSGNQNGKKVYGATWQIEGQTLHDVVNWYESSSAAFEGWQF